MSSGVSSLNSLVLDFLLLIDRSIFDSLQAVLLWYLYFALHLREQNILPALSATTMLHCLQIIVLKNL